MQDNRPVLKHREAFEKILSQYYVSDEAKQILAQTPFVVLSGVAGGGRNTVIKHLVANNNYEFIVSDTTRPPKFRDGQMEQDGINYNFRSEDAVLSELESGDFVEAELIHNQQISGTSIREVQRIIATGRIPIGEFEFGGVDVIANAKPDATIIGIVPPSYDEWVRRLSSRETMSPSELVNRLFTAEKVLENMLSKPYFTLVINDTVEQCAGDIRQIVENSGNVRESDDVRAIASDILQRVKNVLAEAR